VIDREIAMPMPHRTFAQVAKRRLTGKEGRERIREVRALLDELPDYRNGPNADLRKWLTAEIEDTRVRSSAVHRDSIAVRREGAAQIALVGPPNVGKSSLLDEASLAAFRVAAWRLTGLLRVCLRNNGAVDPEPVALEPGSTVADVADWVHHDLVASFVGARVWGTSARFDGQRVGRDHRVEDGDIVEILL
jgi:ribosome-interacting GTPase 1